MKKRLSVLGAVLLSLFLFSYSCQDHQVPGEPPLLSTHELFYDSINGKCSFTTELEVLNIGTIPVTEYGVVFSAVGGGDGPFTDTPMVETHSKVIFDMPFSTGVKTKVGPQICTNNNYYRAYAILSNGTVVYAQTLHFTNL
ncbi:hypothetical protein [Dyadobacter jiangsuensis]|uniref:Lamin tail-like protein n=1 Tax=Dyadobacter jiangsuensis TaxID=1591085 RepID=A0A2P8G444_9BACT|nr:hypothetical protein [Dyadobacter jiangsuensis]PSL28727.1 hypothetical protein CLV60_106330 [Dyadobacter jiangsuensis]